MIFLRRFNVIVSLNTCIKLQQFLRNFPEKQGLALRITEVILSLQNPQFKEKAALCRVDPLLEFLCSQRFDEFIRILIRFHIDNSGRQTCILQDRNGPHSGSHSRIITVIGQKYFIGIPFEDHGLLLRKRSSQRRYRLIEARLVHGDHIHVPFTQNHVWLPACPRQIQSIEVPALVKHLGLRRVQVFRLCISHDPSAESDDPVSAVHNGKHDPVPEFIAHAISFIHLHQPGFFQQRIRIPFAFQVFIQVVAPFAGASKAKLPDGLIRKLPPLEIVKALLSIRLAKHIVIILSCQTVKLHNLFLQICLFSGFR